jgi:Cu(I)/Ag(I) efflux system membrane protein CusA/SilA
MSIGVWVGLIALMGVDAETGVFMLFYLELAYEERRLAGRMNSIADLVYPAIYEVWKWRSVKPQSV